MDVSTKADREIKIQQPTFKMMRENFRQLKTTKFLLSSILTAIGMLFVFVINYPVFETFTQLFVIITGVMIFTVAVITFKHSGNYYLVFIGYTFIFISFMNLVSTFIGLDLIPLVSESKKNVMWQMWTAASFMEGFTFFLLPFLINKEFNHKRPIFGFAIIFGIFIFSIVGFYVFPSCYNINGEFTVFKIIIEIIVIGFLTGGVILLINRRHDIHRQKYNAIIIGLIIMIAAELCLGFTASPPAIIDYAGHILRILSHYCIFVAIAVYGIEAPYIELSKSYDLTLAGWAKALELREKETVGHSKRVTKMATVIAKRMGLDEKALVDIYRGALLHDVGKIGIPDSILLKPGPLTFNERIIIEKHVKYAYDLLSPIPYLKKALEIPHCHHEKWDGTGYPHGLKGEEIPLSARIFAVVDVFDALASDRPYSSAWPIEKIHEYIVEQAGKHFDPRIIRVYQELMIEGRIIDMLNINIGIDKNQTTLL